MRRRCLLLVVAALAAAGCGGPSDVGSVSGTITLDGQPLENALVTFTPTAGGAPSSGRTDSDGQYELQYTRDTKGAEIGDHTVTVSTFLEADPDADPPVPASPEKVPAKFNAQSQLKADVTSGRNTIDFSLDSQGQVIQDHEATASEYDDGTC